MLKLEKFAVPEFHGAVRGLAREAVKFARPFVSHSTTPPEIFDALLDHLDKNAPDKTKKLSKVYTWKSKIESGV